jgi:hypothetical protein
MTVWQPSRDRLWEFWRARKLSDGWHASWGGAIEHVSKSPGYYSAHSWPGLSESDWGATATSLPVIAGTMLVTELRSSRIRHALATDLPAPAAGRYSWPAQRTDGGGPPGAIPEGARLRLPSDLGLRKLHLPRIALMMARAAKRRGIIVRDQTGTAIGFFAQDPGPRPAGPLLRSGRSLRRPVAERHPRQVPVEQARAAEDEPLLRPIAPLPAALAWRARVDRKRTTPRPGTRAAPPWRP